jgi:hypothetical protein
LLLSPVTSPNPHVITNNTHPPHSSPAISRHLLTKNKHTPQPNFATSTTTMTPTSNHHCHTPLTPPAHAVTYQAFREITNFIRNNSNDWDEFCANTTRAARKTNPPPPSGHKASAHKIAELKGGHAPETLLLPNPHRFILFPIQHSDIWKIYKEAEASFWTAEEIDLSRDIADWKKLLPTEQHFISHVLTFFVASDGIVNKNLTGNFATEVTLPEARCFYGFLIAVKNIHNKTYLLLIDTYVKDPSKKTHLLRAIKTIPSVQHKAQWALEWCNPATASFAKCMVTFAAVEGIFFSGAFYAIFWLKKQGLIPGLCFSN